MRIIRYSAYTLLGLLLIVLAIIATMRLGWWNPSYEEVLAKQATPPSKFVQVGDVNLHVRDEGTGPVIIMLHSSMSNLRIYDAWADQLKQDYRVIRFDWPPYGLSTDPNPSTGMPGVVALLEQFVEQEGLEEFSIVGSSSGATISTLYTARNPGKVRALALSVLPLKAPPPTEFTPLVTGMLWLHQNVVPNYNSKFYYRNTLAGLYGNPDLLTDETVDWYYETNNIPGGFARVSQYYTANTQGVWARGAGDEAASVRVPILLQWCDSDPVIPKEAAGEAVAQFANAEVTLIRYPDAGHYPMLEIPDETGADLKAFFDRIYADPPASDAAAAAADAA